jgi:uncharacterized membrane protein
MTKNDLPGNVRIWAAVVLIAVFIIGAAAGAAVWHMVMGDAFQPPLPPVMGPIPLQALDLSDEQHRAVQKIFEDYKPKLESILQETFPRVRAVKEEIEAEVVQLLTDAQKQKFERLKMERPFGPPPGMRPGLGMQPGMGMPPGVGPGMHPDRLRNESDAPLPLPMGPPEPVVDLPPPHRIFDGPPSVEPGEPGPPPPATENLEK